MPGPACASTVRMDPSLSSVPLPPSWPDHVKSAFLHALGMAHLGMAYVRGWCANSPVTQVGLKADNERLGAEIELLREEMRIKTLAWLASPRVIGPVMRRQIGLPSLSSRPAVVGTSSRPPLPS